MKWRENDEKSVTRGNSFLQKAFIKVQAAYTTLYLYTDVFGIRS